VPCHDSGVQATIAKRILDGGAITGTVQLPVVGMSMAPTFADGEIVAMRGDDADTYAIGEIVVFRREGGLVIHRIVDRSRDLIVSRGDARFAPDPPFPASAILGRVEGPSNPMEKASAPARALSATAVMLCGGAMRIHPALGRSAARWLTHIERGPAIARLVALRRMVRLPRMRR
jgi:signal peptidase I